MGKSEIVMILAGIIMTLLLGLAVAPSVGKSTDTSKYAVYNSEIKLLRDVSTLWAFDNNIDGTTTGISTSALESYSRLTKNGSGLLESRVDSGTVYSVSSPDPHQVQITIQGLTISGAESAIKNSQSNIAIVVNDTDPNDGILILTYSL